jgi:hypothetical protein
MTFALAALTLGLLYLGLAGVLFGQSVGTTVSGTPFGLAVILIPLMAALGVTGSEPRRVGASDGSVAIVRGFGRGERFVAVGWEAFAGAPTRVWIPLFGSRYRLRFYHALGDRQETVTLTRRQAELLATFPKGAALHALLD